MTSFNPDDLKNLKQEQKETAKKIASNLSAWEIIQQRAAEKKSGTITNSNETTTPINNPTSNPPTNTSGPKNANSSYESSFNVSTSA